MQERLSLLQELLSKNEKKYSFSVSGSYETTFDIYENEQYKYVNEILVQYINSIK